MSAITTPPSVDVVQTKLSSLRRQYTFARTAIELARLVILILVTWCGLAAIDFVFELPLGWRRALFAMAALGIVLFASLRFRKTYAEFTQQHVASLLERQFDGFGQRLRTILDTLSGRVTAPQEMLSALGHQALGRWDTVATKEILPSRSVGIWAGVCVCVAMLCGVLFANDHSRISLLRAAAFNAEYSSLDVQPGNVTILEGEDVALQLEMRGRKSPEVTLSYRFLPDVKSTASDSLGREIGEESKVAEEPSWIELDIPAVSPDSDSLGSADVPESENLEPENLPTESLSEDNDLRFSLDQPATFTTWLRNLSRPVEYRFMSEAGDTKVYRVDVRPLVDVVDFKMQVDAPEYTGAGVREFSKRKVDVLAGSDVLGRITTSHPLETARLLVGPKPSQLEPVEWLVADDDHPRLGVLYCGTKLTLLAVRRRQLRSSSSFPFRWPTSRSCRWPTTAEVA